MQTDVNVGHPEAILVFLSVSLKQFTIKTYNTNFRKVPNAAAYLIEASRYKSESLGFESG